MLLSVLQIARHEFRMTLRERSGWGVIVTACALAFLDAALKPPLPVVAGVRASMFGCALILAPLSLVFVSGAARRDEAFGAGDVVDSRPYPAHMLFLARLIGNYAVALFAYVLVIIFTLAAPLVLAGRFPSPSIALHAFARGIVPLFYIVALAYCGVVLARNVLAAAVVAVYWVFILLWGDFLARVFNFSLTQNWPTYALLGLGIVLGTAAWRRRSETPAKGRRHSPMLPATAAALVLLGLLNAWQRVAWSHDKPFRQDPFAIQLAAQHLDTSPRLPGFWLPDQSGGWARMSDTRGKALLVAFWTPHRPESMRVLDTLQTVVREFPDQSVACVSICLSDDHAISPHVARDGRYTFTMVTDTATHFAGKIDTCAPLAEAYQVEDLPAVFVADRGGRLVDQFTWISIPEPEALAAQVGEARSIPVPPGVGVERI